MSPRTLTAVFSLLVCTSAQAEMFKCRVGDRTLYQSSPCPAGSVATPMAAPAPEPDVWSVNEAQRRARAEQDQLKALDQKTAAQDKVERQAAAEQAQETRKRAKECDALRKDIQQAEDKAAKAARKKGTRVVEGKQLGKDKEKYASECGAL
ncbi:MAG: hypothetical protein HZB71_14290 [Betaproteobacteria bacterium]|nr:hypothetical protein [Betaproteobacteria bacterium]